MFLNISTIYVSAIIYASASYDLCYDLRYALYYAYIMLNIFDDLSAFELNNFCRCSNIGYHYGLYVSACRVSS